MAEDPIPSDVKQFILTNIDSIAQLEALLLLCAAPAEKWTVAAVAKRLYITEQETAPLLASLCERGLIVISDGESAQYAYQQISPDLARMVDRLAEVYANHLVPVTNTTWKVIPLGIVNWLLAIVIPGENAFSPAFQ